MKLIQITSHSIIKELLLTDNIYLNILGLKDINLFKDYNKFKWYKISTSNIPIGLFILHEYLKDKYFFHVGIYKDYRGNAANIVKRCLNLLPSNYNTEFFASIKDTNLVAHKAIKKLGFVPIKQVNNITIYGELQPEVKL